MAFIAIYTKKYLSEHSISMLLVWLFFGKYLLKKYFCKLRFLGMIAYLFLDKLLIETNKIKKFSFFNEGYNLNLDRYPADWVN